MLASQKEVAGTSSQKREDKLLGAMTKLSYFTMIVAVIELVTFGSRMLGAIRNLPSAEGIVGSAELAWPVSWGQSLQ